MLIISADKAETQTIANNNRIDVIDVLRGLALLGIIISHISSSFSSGIPHVNSRIDGILYKAVELFVMDKFYLIFSFLFGLSFFIQLQRATAKKKKFVGRFIWRSIILLVIGNIHTLFYTGDVLHSYAILGLLLLVVYPLNNKLLIVLSAILIFCNPYLLKLPEKINPPQPAVVAAQKTFDNKLMQNAVKVRVGGTVMDVIKSNIDLAKRYYFTIINRHIMILGLFLLGVVAGRKNLFANTPANVKTFVKMLVIGGIASFISMYLLRTNMAIVSEFRDVLLVFLQMALACFYVAGVTLLYWNTPVKRILQWLNPVGKMGLTTYLMQSVFGLLFFYGFGLGMATKVTVTVSLCSVTLFFIFQILFANWWMSRFRYGPVEWLWRSLTYLEVQPMSKAKN